MEYLAEKFDLLFVTTDQSGARKIDSIVRPLIVRGIVITKVDHQGTFRWRRQGLAFLSIQIALAPLMEVKTVTEAIQALMSIGASRLPATILTLILSLREALVLPRQLDETITGLLDMISVCMKIVETRIAAEIRKIFLPFTHHVTRTHIRRLVHEPIDQSRDLHNLRTSAFVKA